MPKGLHMCNFCCTFDLLPHEWGPLRKYGRVLQTICKCGHFLTSLMAFLFCADTYCLMQA